jgi:UDP:flavonoid glycosyltransferase YjiC (YdhE family)
MRAEESGHGFKLDRYQWTESQLAEKLAACLNDEGMRQRLQRTSAQMQSRKGPADAAAILDKVLNHA